MNDKALTQTSERSLPRAVGAAGESCRLSAAGVARIACRNAGASLEMSVTRTHACQRDGGRSSAVDGGAAKRALPNATGVTDVHASATRLCVPFPARCNAGGRVNSIAA